MADFTNIMRQIKKQIDTSFKDSDIYINRELSWIGFNTRVLHQATKKSVPLVERLKFLSISSSNIDEFIMVRLASVLNRIGTPHKDITGMDAVEEYELILNSLVSFKRSQEQVYKNLVSILEQNKICFSDIKSLTEDEFQETKKIFRKFIYPLLTPISCDSTKDFPLIKSKQLNIIVELEDNINPNLNVLSIIPIPNGLPRVFKIEGDSGEIKLIMVEDIIRSNLDKIFVNKKIVNMGIMRLLRAADIELDNDTDIYLIDRIKQNLRLRENSTPIYIETKDISKQALKILTKMLDVSKFNVYKTNSTLDFTFLMDLPDLENDFLHYQKFTPQYPEALIGERDMFSAIDSDDVLLHHPYESYEPVIKFLEHASNDDDVLAIKQTLYRVSSKESPIVNALCRAAENGKSVSVLLELKARFDEGQNLNLIEKLKASGCHITFGIEDLKTHCKFISVIRKSKKGLRIYSHIGTGNYNDKTAKIYTDISLFTSNQSIGEDLIALFNILSGFSDSSHNNIKALYYSPYNIRSTLHKMIDNEIEISRQTGKQGHIIIKVNSLSDRDIIRKLFQASVNNVKVTIICRGVCSMKPINKNIEIKSVIGRFLEHSRIYYFSNAGKPRLFISSADLLTRNLDRRIEILCPIKNKTTKEKLLNILDVYLKDSVHDYVMDKTGKFVICNKGSEKSPQDIFMKKAESEYKYRNIAKEIKYKKR